jgi:hypothetical protein
MTARFCYWTAPIANRLPKRLTQNLWRKQSIKPKSRTSAGIDARLSIGSFLLRTRFPQESCFGKGRKQANIIHARSGTASSAGTSWASGPANLQKGAYIEIEGELRYREFTPTESDRSVRVAEIYASSILCCWTGLIGSRPQILATQSLSTNKLIKTRQSGMGPNRCPTFHSNFITLALRCHKTCLCMRLLIQLLVMLANEHSSPRSRFL